MVGACSQSLRDKKKTDKNGRITYHPSQIDGLRYVLGHEPARLLGRMNACKVQDSCNTPRVHKRKKKKIRHPSTHLRDSDRGRTHLLLALGHWTIDDASLSRRSTVPTPSKRHLQRLGVHNVISLSSIETFCYSYPLPASPSVATSYLLG